MASNESGRPEAVQVIDRQQLDGLFAALRRRGYELVGPTVSEGAIVYGPLASVADLPRGWTDEQEGGSYRLKQRGDEALFGYNVGPHSWKKYLLPPSLRLWQIHKTGDGGMEVVPEPETAPRLAFIGVRACELQAIAIQDQVFMGGPYVDPTYRSRRENVFIVAVNCGQAGNTCFCVSMDAGPRARAGFDLAITEVMEGERHYFTTETGSPLGAEVLAEVPHRVAKDLESGRAEQIVAQTALQMGRQMDTAGIKELLYRNVESPRWDEIASRCLTCANCTLACPTCFCTTVEDTTDLSGDHAERWRKWDSCFTSDFSYLHGGSVRASGKSRYRQWLTHKLASWIDQFGSSGCVGCGRCITWCPVAIDLTAEVRGFREDEQAKQAGSEERQHADVSIWFG